MKVFISWSGSMSQSVARALHDWLPCVLQAVQPFVSTLDIAKGSRWDETLAHQLEATEFGIVCLTPFNLHAPWLTFEAGALSKAVKTSRIMPFLFHVDSALPAPLAQFQVTRPVKDEVLRLVSSMNELLGEARVEGEVLHRIFAKWWHDLEKQLDNIPNIQEGSTETGLDWLFRPGDLARHEVAAPIRSIWIVTPSRDGDLQRDCITDMVKNNKDRQIHYTFIMPEATPKEDALITRVLGEIFAGSASRYDKRYIDPDIFERQAVTHYIVLNPDISDSNPEVLLELPIEQYEQHGYWVKVSRKAAFGFRDRFREMIDNPLGVQAVSVPPPGPVAPGTIAASQ